MFIYWSSSRYHKFRYQSEHRLLIGERTTFKPWYTETPGGEGQGKTLLMQRDLKLPLLSSKNSFAVHCLGSMLGLATLLVHTS